MRILSNIQCNCISGGLVTDFMICEVPSIGIPSMNFAHLEHAMGQLLTNSWARDDVEGYLVSKDSFQYFSLYQQNFASADCRLL